MRLIPNSGKGPFGIMFHHFHGLNHPASQGSISAEDLDMMIDKLKKNFQINDVNDFYEKLISHKFTPKDICLTFDDSLLCQFDIALPVLESYGIKALFNIYSSAFSGNPSPLEIYRYFRSISYTNFDEFYKDFFEVVQNKYHAQHEYGLLRFELEKRMYDDFPFYSDHDRVFRFFRDKILEHTQYQQIMLYLMNNKGFEPDSTPAKIFMSEIQLSKLNLMGHSIGLHSDTHPTQIGQLSKEKQLNEYLVNYNFLKNVLSLNPKMMAHPCGQYSDITLDILRNLGIELGFRSSMSVPHIKSLLEVPREDHSNIMANLG